MFILDEYTEHYNICFSFIVTLQKLNIAPTLPYSFFVDQLAGYMQSTVKKVLIVGSNPSTASPDNSAFHTDTKSRKFIDSWFVNKTYDISYLNLVDFKTSNNIALSDADIKNNIKHIKKKLSPYSNYKLIALGKSVDKTFKLANITNYFHMPHPSGLNRAWNNPEFSKNKIEELIQWIENG